MKKCFKRIIGIISVLVLGYQQFCYADLVTISKPDFTALPVVCIIGIVTLIISVLSFLSLKIAVRKQSIFDYVNEKPFDIDTEEIDKRKKKKQGRFFFLGIILSIIGLVFLDIEVQIDVLFWYIPYGLLLAFFIGLFILSFIVMKKTNKRVLGIICVILATTVCLIGLGAGLSKKLIEDYNEQFLQYGDSEYDRWTTYTVDINGLINTAIKTNKSGIKTTFTYQDQNYTTPDELEQLLSKLNTNIIYTLDINYGKHFGYIKSIKLDSYICFSLQDYYWYKGSNKKGTSVIKLLELSKSKLYFNKVKIIYISETGRETTICNNKSISEDFEDLKNEIKEDRVYNVEFQTDTDFVGIIIITSENHRS